MSGDRTLGDLSWDRSDNILVLSASRSLRSVFDQIDAGSFDWVVLVRQHPDTAETYYYAFRPQEFDEYRSHDPADLDRPAALAMDMHEWTSSGQSRNGRPVGEGRGTATPSASRVVDLDLGGRVQAIGEAGVTHAGGGVGPRPGPPESAGGELPFDLGAQRGSGTRGGDTGGLEGVEPEQIEITMSAETSEQLAVDATAMVPFKIELTQEASPLAHEATATARADEDIAVSLTAQNDRLQVLASDPQLVPPPGPGRPRTGFFQIRGRREGVCELAVRFSQGGTDLGVVWLTVDVGAGAALGPARSRSAVAAPRDPSDDDKLALEVELRGEGNSLYYDYRLYSESLGFHARRFRSDALKDRDAPAKKVLDHVKWLYQQVTRELQVDRDPGDLARLAREVRALGANLSEQLFPADAVKALWPLRDRIHLIQVISWEPYIPWEMLRLRHPETGDIDDRFLGEYGLVRTMSYSSPPRELSLGSWQYLGAEFPSGRMASVGREISYFTGDGPGTLKARNIEAQPIPPNGDAFYDALRRNDFDVLHIACHAESEEDEIENARLIIGEWTDRATGNNHFIDVGPSVISAEARWQRRHPLVFLNACETARTGPMLTAWGGWPDVFVRCGAGAFVGSAWSVRDGPASLFSTAFYEALLDGKPLFEAAAAARNAARFAPSGQELDASWLAYKVFGHPRARAVPAPPAPGPN